MARQSKPLDRILLYAWVNDTKEAVDAIANVSAFAALTAEGVQGLSPYPEAFAKSKQGNGSTAAGKTNHASGYLLWRVAANFSELCQNFPSLEVCYGRGKGTVPSYKLMLQHFDIFIVDPVLLERGAADTRGPYPLTAGIAMLTCYVQTDASGEITTIRRARMRRAVGTLKQKCAKALLQQMQHPAYSQHFPQRARLEDTVAVIEAGRVAEYARMAASATAYRATSPTTPISDTSSSDDDAAWPSLPMRPQQPQRSPALLPRRAWAGDAVDPMMYQPARDKENDKHTADLELSMKAEFQCSHKRPCYKSTCRACIARRCALCNIIDDVEKAVWFGTDSPFHLIVRETSWA